MLMSIEFIDLYRIYPFLWKINCKDLKNKHEKNYDYDSLIKKMCKNYQPSHFNLKKNNNIKES